MMRFIIFVLLIFPIIAQGQYYPISHTDTIYSDGVGLRSGLTQVTKGRPQKYMPDPGDVDGLLMVATTDSLTVTFYPMSGGAADLIVNWGDADIDTVNTSGQTYGHKYSDSAQYWISFTGVTTGVEWYLNVDNEGIDRLYVEDLPQLHTLYCDTNNLVSIDLGHCDSLYRFYCGNNSIVTLDFSNNPDLFDLYCVTNELTSIDLTHCTELSTCNISYNHALGNTNFLNNTKLTVLDMGECAMTTLDVTHCTLLTTLGAHNIPISALDVTPCTVMENLWINNTSITAIDISKCIKLYCFMAFNSPIAAFDFSSNPELLQLNVQSTAIDTINVDTNIKLTSLVFSYNHVRNLDITNNTALTYIQLLGNDFTEAAMTTAIGTLHDRTAHTPAGALSSVPQNATFLQTLTAGQQAALTGKNWTY